MKPTLLLSLLLITFLSPFAQSSQWTWMSGDNRLFQIGVYGFKGVAGAANKPGARADAVSWSDASGNLWLFGGYGYSTIRDGYLNDLWKYDISTGLWTWVSGDQIPDQSAVSVGRGIAAAANKPGGRTQATAWTDASGTFWLFGGIGYSASGRGDLNDLWSYSTTTNQWTWVSGDIVPGQPAIYGVRGIADAANKPGARYGSSGGRDAAGNLWLFGGTASGQLNELWKYNLQTGQWTWISGDKAVDQPSIYGSRGIADAANKPSGRSFTAVWPVASGDLWLYGGLSTYYNPLPVTFKSMGDLWKFTISTGQWTWVGGDSTPYPTSLYGTKGVAASGNRPGSRSTAVSLTDASGNLLLHGGEGSGRNSYGYFNDLWQYSPSSNQWTWVTGDSVPNQFAVYGLKGVSSPDNKPGGKYSHVGWLDPSGNLWVFGGSGLSATQYGGTINDLWKYTLSATGVPSVINSFTAQKESQAVTLSWTSTPDQNLRAFIVERYNGTVTGYQSIGTVAALGSSSRYSFTDNAPLAGTNFYRIRQVDQAGSGAYSSTAQVDMSQYATQFSIYQNPVQNVLQLIMQLPAKQKITLQVRDMNGHVLIQQEQTGYSGRASFSVPVDRLSKGTYLIQVQSESINNTKTFIKQ